METAYPLELRQAGYRTGFFGKSHQAKRSDFKPEELFDEYEEIWRTPYFKTLPDGSKRHTTDIIADRGIAFIESQPKDQPFCLNLWFNAPHAEDQDRRPGIGHYPWPPSADGLYEDVTIPEPRLGDDAIYASQPDFLKDSINRERYFWGYDTPEKYHTNLRAYFRMITGIDNAAARVLEALEKAGLADNTIIVFSSDNGYYLGDRGFQGKWSHYDESLRVPLLVYDPRLANSQRGRVVEEIALTLDLPSTFLDWADVAEPDGYQGVSLRPLVEGAPSSPWRNAFFCEHLYLAPKITWEGIRGERYMYARYFDQPAPNEFLYDLERDPDQLQNLASHPDYADILRELRKQCDVEVARRGGALADYEERKR